MHRLIVSLPAVAAAWIVALATVETASATPPFFGIRAEQPEAAIDRHQPGVQWNGPPSGSAPISQPRMQPGAGWNEPPEPSRQGFSAARTQPGTEWNQPNEAPALRSQPGTGWNEPAEPGGGWGWNPPQAPARTQPGASWNQPGTSWNQPGASWNQPGTNWSEPTTSGNPGQWPAGQTSQPVNYRQSNPVQSTQQPLQANKIRPTGQPLEPNPPPNRTPANQSASEHITIRNLTSNGSTLHYRIDGIAFRMLPGYKHVLPGSKTYVIEFHAGEPDQIKRYTLFPAVYHFTPTEQGWELYRQHAGGVSQGS